MFDQSKSNLNDEKRREWHDRKISGDFKKDKVPGVGEATQKILATHDIKNTYQLIGDMLKFVTEPFTSVEKVQEFGQEYFTRLVTGFKSPKAHAHTTVDALMSKVTVGIQIANIEIPPSSMDDAKWLTFRGKQDNRGRYVLGGKLEDDFDYIGDKVAEKLGKDSDDPILNSWQLVGLFLSYYSPDAPEESVEKFKKRLGSYGKGIQTSCVVAQIVEILNCGMVLIPRV
jgi:hypothetical protein